MSIFDQCFEMPVYGIRIIFTILVLIEISLANSVLFNNSHIRNAAYCLAKAIMMTSNLRALHLYITRYVAMYARRLL